MTQDDLTIPNSDDISPADIQPHAGLSGSDLSEAALRFADLSGADLTGAILTDADLSGTDLSHARLSGTDLSHARLSGTDLSDADLSGTDLSHADLIAVSLDDVQLTNSQARQAQLTDAQLKSFNLEHSLYEDAPARVEVEFEYAGPDSPADESDVISHRDYFERVSSEIREFEEVMVPSLSCDCGESFQSWEAAAEHIKKFQE